MNNRKYFDNFTMGVTLFIITIMVLFILGGISKHILTENGLMYGSEKSKTITETGKTIKLIGTAFLGGLVIYSLFCFFQFMRKAKHRMLFSSVTSALWKRINAIYFIIGIVLILFGFIKTSFLSGSLIYGLVSSIAYSFSKIFKDGAFLKSENDLTI
jgi:hypothetical protein